MSLPRKRKIKHSCIDRELDESYRKRVRLNVGGVTHEVKINIT